MLDLLRSVTVYKGLQIGSDVPSSLGLVFVVFYLLLLFLFFVLFFVFFFFFFIVVVLLLLLSLLCRRFHSNCLRSISSPQEGTYYFVNPVDHYCESGPQRVKIWIFKIHISVRCALHASSKIFVGAAKDVL